MNLNIKQEDISDGILENFPDNVGNKIRLREVSFANLIRHVASIPFSAKDDSKTVEYTSSFEIAEEPIDSLLVGQNKPISVKKNMLENIIKHSGYFNKVESPVEINNAQGDQANNSDFSNNENSIVTDNNASFIMDPSFYTQDSDTSSAEKDDAISSNFDENTNSEEKNDVSFDSDKVVFDDIANARELIIHAKKDAEEAEVRAQKSDEELSRISVEETEVQKRLQDAIARQREIRKQISIAMENQRLTLAEVKKRYDSVILDANRRKEENQSKISEFQNRIVGTQQQITEIENDISEQQNILNALRDLEEQNSTSFSNTDDQQMIKRRVA